MAKKKHVEIFSVTKAVKANARERLGTPPPSVAIPHERSKVEHGPEKHKRKLEEIVGHAEEAS